MKVKIVILIALWIFFLSGLSFQSALTDFKINAKAAILMDPVSGKVLYSQSAHQRLPPASVTKVMTMLLVMEAVDSGRAHWNDPITTTATAAGMGGSQIYLKEGEEMTLDEMFKAIAVVSANDASTAVAEHLYGAVEDFIDAMNQRAKQLGLKDTHFANETGLPDPEHYSSAYDLAIICRELLKHPRILRYSSIWLDKLRGGKFVLRNTNELIKVYRGADGLKTGHTAEAKFCLAATAHKGDFRLLSVILGADSDAMRVAQSKRLLDYGYRNFQWKSIYHSNNVIGRVHIKNANQEYIPVKLDRNFGVVVNRGQDQLIKTQIKPFADLKMPISAGKQVGTVEALLNGRVLAQAPIYTTQKVTRANFLVLGWRWMRDLVKNLFTKKNQELKDAFFLAI